MPRFGEQGWQPKKKRRKKIGRAYKGKGKDVKRAAAAAAAAAKDVQKGKRKALVSDHIQHEHVSPKKVHRAAAEQAESKRRAQMAAASTGCERDVIGERAFRCAIAVHFVRLLDYPDQGEWGGKDGAIRSIMDHFSIPDGSSATVIAKALLKPASKSLWAWPPKRRRSEVVVVIKY